MPMKTRSNLVSVAILLLRFCSHGQGTFLYDQQSAIEGLNGEFSVNIISSQPVGQSFTPSLNAVDFVRLHFENLGIGGSAYVNLRAGSITGSIVAASSPVSLPDQFHGYTDFLFSTSVSVTPGIEYFFQPIVQSGTGWFLDSWNGFGYSGGAAILLGDVVNGHDFWFREGIVVPEPSAAVLILAGLAMTRFIRKTRK